MIAHAADACDGETRWVGGSFFSENPVNEVGALYNVAIRMDTQVSAMQFLYEAARYFRARNKGFFLWTEDGTDTDLQHAARRMGLSETGSAETDPVMARCGGLRHVRMPENVQVSKVTRDTGLKTFAELVNSVYQGQAQAIVRTMVSDLRSGGDAGMRGYVLSSQGVAVSCAVTFLRNGVQGIYMVGTKVEHRGHGYATHLVSHLLAEGRSAPIRASVLESTETAVPIYRKLGFEVVGGGPAFVATSEQCGALAALPGAVGANPSAVRS